MPARLFTIAATFSFLALSGCGPAKLDLNKTYDLGPAESRTLTLPAQPKPQRITVEYEANNPVEVSIFKAEDAKDPETLPMSKALVTEKSKTSGTVAVDLGPDVSTVVVVSALSKTTSVKVNVTNRK